jgi:ankyrin repeat protein
VAAAAGRADVVEGLLAAGCDPNRPLQRDALQGEPAQQRQQQQQVSEATDGAPDPSSSPKQQPAGEQQQQQQQQQQPATLLSGLPPQEWQVEGPAGLPAGGEAAAQLLAPSSLSGCTPLHLAAHAGQLGALEALLAASSCNPRARSLAGYTPLHLAAAGGHAGVVARLCRVPGVWPGCDACAACAVPLRCPAWAACLEPSPRAAPEPMCSVASALGHGSSNRPLPAAAGP